ncbi:GNAT family N-acetyltransferase [Patulibacter sp. SYSU D01012]|uniref:GNAT family N-acetyltransferase n=1 Tax=Patulibacter sp. SYSU D01012 TaxID=2817381 RepID=UPI001B30FA1F|nr:GNAT family N-acetyltransferase [Patulibacter sp. SYSU D01012]
MTAGPLRVRALPSGPDGRPTAEALARAAAAWATIEAARPTLPVSRTWAWTRAWLTHFGPRIAHELLVVEDAAGAVRGATLLTRGVRRYGPLPVRRLHVGTGGEPGAERLCPEANLPAARPGDDAAVLAAVVAAARARRGWDELRVERADAAALAPTVDAWPAARVAVETMPAYEYRLHALADDQDVPGGLRGGPRRRVRTSLRAMEARGPLTLEWATDATAARGVLEDLIALHQDAWRAAGRPGIFASAAFAGFHRELAPRLVKDGRATLVRVRCGDETIAALYGFRDGERLRAYQSGLRRFDDNRLRPGIVAHVLAMEEARRRGVAVYDHLAGDARYKRELSTATTETRSYALRRPRLRHALVDGARGVRDRRAARVRPPAGGAPVAGTAA